MQWYIARHEAHQNAVLAQAIFLQDQTIIECFAEQSKAEAARRKVEVDANRALLKRVLDAIIFFTRTSRTFYRRFCKFGQFSRNIEISCPLRCQNSKAPI